MRPSDGDRVVALIAARERGTLPRDEEDELRRILEENPEQAAYAGGDRAIERLLRYAGGEELGAEEFTRGVAARIAAERRGEEFVRRVNRRLRARRLARPPGSGASFAWAAAAACVGVVILAAVLSRGQRTPELAKVARTTPIARPATSDEREAERRETPVARTEPETVRPSPREAPVVDPPPTPAPANPAKPIADRVPEPARTTRAVLGTLEGRPLLTGQVVDTAAWGGKAVLRLSDGTRFELGEDTRLQMPEAGKRFTLARGIVAADVTRQPLDAPVAFETPHGEAAVLGTSLRLAVEKAGTRLEVTEGRVRLTRAADGKSVEVAAGQFAVASSGVELKAKPIPDPRVTEGLRALYVFEEGKGRVIRDVSGVGTPLHLVAKEESALGWIPGGGLALRSPTLVASSGPATKILSACRSSRAITVEAWIRPAQVDPGTLRFVAALGGPRKESLAFGLGLHIDVGAAPVTYRVYLTTPKTTPTSDYVPEMESKPIVPGLAHVVFSRAPSGAAVLTVDGQERASGTVEGDFSIWSDSLRLMLGGSSFEGERPWVGEFYLLAVYNRALKPEEVLQNLAAGKRKPWASKK